MCGIAGIYTDNGVWGLPELTGMTERLKHRGPDASGHFLHQGFGLGHRRLSIIDLSEAANQPFHSACGRYVMVYNGEVYNHREVARELGIVARTTSDTEVILEAFAKKGPTMVSMLNGMFAMAILDKHENTLFLFRDRMGIKPLYYSQKDGALVFGSELKCVTPLIKEPTIDDGAVASYLHLGYIPQPLSIYKEVRKFPSGSYALYKKGKLTFTTYWDPADKIKSHIENNEKQATDTLETLLMSSVEKRLMSDVPFGTFLSGGIDSSMVTALAQANSTERIKTFSIGSVEPKYNESEFARAVAKHLGTYHHEYTISENDALELVNDIVEWYDEPYADSSAIPTMLVSRIARQEVTMTLSGDGGDELFMGYGAYHWANRLNKPHFRALRKPISALLAMGNDHKKRAAKVFNWNNPANLPSHIFSQEQYLFSEEEVAELLINKADSSPKDQFVNMIRTLDPSEAQAFFDLRYYLKDDLLTKVDRASMRYSLETRVPLLDHEIVEFALNLSPELKIKNGESKYLLKQVLYRHVPKEIFDRPKWGFSIPLVKWLHTDLAYLIDDHLSKENVEQFGLVKWHVVEKLIRKFRSGQDHLYNRLWLLIILHQWKKRFDKTC